MDIILIISIIALILLVWFRTNAWLEYTSILDLKINNEYQTFIENIEFVSFIDYIRNKSYDIRIKSYKRWGLRLITCPICLGVWLGIIMGLFTSLLNVPIFICGGILLYATINKLLS